MEIVQVDEKVIEGMSVRTTNANEMNPEKSKIASLHQRFDEVVSVDYAKGFRVYAIYYGYESDASGEYSVLAGSDQLSNPSNQNLQKLKILSGNYMLFNAEGSVPEIVIDTWTKIWTYFEQENNEHQRFFTTDFELYKSPTEIEIYIAIK